MRVITGSARGVTLVTLEGDAVRPTTGKTKEAIFSAIQFDIEGRRVLDLFAGSGQLGIEALSRGAEKATFIDASAESIDIVKKNVKKCGFEKQSVIYKSDYASFLRGTKETFDIVFLDPPYNADYIGDVISKTADILSEYGIMICEHSAKADVPQEAGEFAIYRQYKYGKLVTVTVYKNKKVI
jgi:16S rRNA (guanine(966)-N(2))-methyltransferase RsmD